MVLGVLTLIVVVIGTARVAAFLSHAGEVGAVVAGVGVVVNIDLDASATPFGNLGRGSTSVASAIFGSPVFDVCHVSVFLVGGVFLPPLRTEWISSSPAR